VDPTNGKPTQVFLTRRRLEFVAKRGAYAILEAKHTVAEVLLKPSAVFEGIRCDGDEDRDPQSNCEGWRCYCGKPKLGYFTARDGRPTTAKPGEVFLVFVNGEHVAYNWRWEATDPTNLDLPKDSEGRFKRRLL
jgi:hypothetical protein